MFKKFAIILLFQLNSNMVFSQNLQKDTVEKSTIDLNEVIISVNKDEESKKTIAQQVQVIRSEQIINQLAPSTADLLANSGNVYVQKSQQGGGSPVLRGFEANRILLVVDGVRMNNLIYRGGHLQNIITTDNAILDRIEIMFGPSSTVYGSDALGGVIHMYTCNPVLVKSDSAKKISADAFARFGSVNKEKTAHFKIGIGGKSIASLTSVTFSGFEDLEGGKSRNPFYDSSYGERPHYAERFGDTDSVVVNSDPFLQIPSGYSQFDILQKILISKNDRIRHGVNIQYSNSTDVPRYDRLTEPDGAGLRFAEWYYGPQKRFLAAYDFNYLNESAFFQTVHAGINYQDIQESRHSRRFGRNNLQHRNEDVNVIGTNIDFKRISGNHHMRIGIDAQYNTLKSTANEEDIITGDSSPLDTRYPDGDNEMTNTAVYWSHTWRINDKTTINDGVRLGYVSLHSSFVDTTFYNFPFTEAEQKNFVYSGSLGLIRTHSDDLKLSLLLSTGFRNPNVDDLSKVFESSPGTVIVPNPDLNPEKTINTEFTVTKLFKSRISFENTIYYTQFIDAIVTQPTTFNGSDSILYDGTMSLVLSNQNKRSAYIWGFSSSLKSQLANKFFLTFFMNYTYGRIKTDSSDYPLDHIPPFNMRLQFMYTNKNFSCDLTSNYNSWKRIEDYYLGGEDNEQYATAGGMPAWLTVNFGTSLKLDKQITLQVRVDNIFDTQYRTFASGINAPGRNFIGCVRFHY